MNKILLSTGSTYGHLNTLETQELACELGFDGIELMLDSTVLAEIKVNPSSLQHLKHVHVVHAPLYSPGGHAYLPSITLAIKLAKRLEAPHIVVHPHSKRWFYGGKTARDKAALALGLLEAKHGVKVCVEVLPKPSGTPYNYIKTWFQQPFSNPYDWVSYISRYNMHACFDTTHCATWGKEAQADHIIQLIGTQLCHVHFSDYSMLSNREHLVPGQGTYTDTLRKTLLQIKETAPWVNLSIEITPGQTKKDTIDRVKTSLDFIVS